MNWYPVKPMPGGRPLGGLFTRLRDDPAWHCEAKIDGIRAVWEYEQLWTRTRRKLEVPDDLRRALAALTWDVPLDGELRDGVYWVFDTPDSPAPLRARRALLAGLLRQVPEPVRLMPLATWDEVIEQDWEGCVFKRLESVYEKSTARNSTTPDWIKYRKEWL